MAGSRRRMAWKACSAHMQVKESERADYTQRGWATMTVVGMSAKSQSVAARVSPDQRSEDVWNFRMDY